MAITINQLSFSYDHRTILSGIDFHAKEGEFISVLGPNGVGKSTLFRCILGLLPGYTGEIRIGDIDARTLKPAELAKRIAYIPQSGTSVFHYSVLDMVLMGTTNELASFQSPGQKQQSRAMEALAKVGIEGLADRCFHKLSGGEQQLVLLARALAQNARILLLDEPTASLDFGNQYRVLLQLKSLAREGYTLLLATHNPEHSFLFSDRILALSGGTILADGAPREVLTGELLGKLYGIDLITTSVLDDRARMWLPTDVINPMGVINPTDLIHKESQ